MKVLRTFKYSNDHEVERRVDNKVDSVTCWCKATAFKMLSSPKYFNNTVGKSPSAR